MAMTHSPLEYCKSKALASGSSFYYSFLFLPEKQKNAMIIVYAFCREVDDVVDECSDPTVARQKLNFWREEIARTFANQPTHPIGQALLKPISHFQLPQELFLDIIDGMEMDLTYTAYNTFNELQQYCYKVAGVVGLLTIRILGYSDKNTEQYAIHLGTALQLVNIIRDLGEDIHRGRIYLPVEELEQFGVTEASLTERQMTEPLRDLLRFQAKRARDYFQQAVAALPESDRFAQRIGLIMAEIYFSLLAEIERDDFNVLTQRITLTPIRKLWITCRTLRREKKRHQKWIKHEA
jgi:15-cis-phytoene synthase